VHGHRDVYDSEWVRVSLADVEIPGDRRFEHHVVSFPRPSVTAIVTSDDASQVLLLWRHRFITGAWGWEVPAGWAEPGEDLSKAAAREVQEETGYRPAAMRPLIAYNALSGISDMRFTAFVANGAERLGPPADRSESSRVEWVPVPDVAKLAGAGHIQDGPSLTALMYFLATQRAGTERYGD
jgi:8-oxo-dGTP pyrophosphatase MutT (NUDIX family)